ncbi:MAG: SHOCT domain-containing protein [Ruminococcaceae bacterium]|nr:SHOCT domain-containing protein [Oscillospiraceae bacterium]
MGVMVMAISAVVTFIAAINLNYFIVFLGIVGCFAGAFIISHESDKETQEEIRTAKEQRNKEFAQKFYELYDDQEKDFLSQLASLKSKYQNVYQENSKLKELVLYDDLEIVHYELYAYDSYMSSNEIFQNFDAVKQRQKMLDYIINGWSNVTEKFFKVEIKKLLKTNDILYFEMIGDVQYTTKVSGGDVKISGGGSSIKGAVVGGIIAGGAGAIIGSRKEVTGEGKPIVSTTQTHDSREVLIKYKNGKEEKLELWWYEVLMEIIPQKEKGYIDFNKSQDSVDIEKLKLMKELFDQGILTEEEFSKKKAELLK